MAWTIEVFTRRNGHFWEIGFLKEWFFFCGLGGGTLRRLLRAPRHDSQLRHFRRVAASVHSKGRPGHVHRRKRAHLARHFDFSCALSQINSAASMASASPPSALEGITYRQPNLRDFTLDDRDLERTCPLDNGRHTIIVSHDLGTLDALPLELLRLILVRTDLRSLTNFRRINNRAIQIVDSILEYQTIVNYSLGSLRGALSTGLASHISCRDLAYALHESRCETCGDFAGFINLFTCKRVCFLCFCEEPRYYPLRVSEVERSFAIPHRLIASLPTLRSLPGRYAPNEYSCKTRITLIDSDTARRAGIEHHGSAQAMEQCAAEVTQHKLDLHRQRVATDPGSNSRRSMKSGVEIGGVADPRRFMAIVRAPSVDRSTKTVEWGFHCKGCEKSYRRRPMHWRRKYCFETFEEHIKECGPITNGRHRVMDKSENRS